MATGIASIIDQHANAALHDASIVDKLAALHHAVATQIAAPMGALL